MAPPRKRSQASSAGFLSPEDEAKLLELVGPGGLGSAPVPRIPAVAQQDAYDPDIAAALSAPAVPANAEAQAEIDPDIAAALSSPQAEQWVPTQTPVEQPSAPADSDLAAQGQQYLEMWQDPVRFAKGIGGAGLNFLGAAIGGAPGTGVLSNTLRAAAGGGVSGAGSALARGGDAIDALVEGGIGAGVGGGISGTLGVTGAVGKVAADELQRRGYINRAGASGMYGAQLRNYAQNHGGGDAVEALGRDIEARGLHRGNYPGGNWNPLNWLPQSWGTYEENARNLMQRAGAQMGAAEDAIAQGARPVAVNLDPTLQSLDERAARAGRMWDQAAGRAEQRFAGDMADSIRSRTPSVVGEGHFADLPEAIENRRYIDNEIDWTRKGGGGPNAPMQEHVRREVAGNLRAGTKDAITNAGNTGVIDQGLAQRWLQNNDDYRVAAAVHDPAIARVYQEYGNQAVSLPAWAGLGMGGPQGLAAAFMAQQLKERGRSAFAGTLGGLAAGTRAATGLATATQAVHPAIGTGAASLVHGTEEEEDARRRALEEWLMEKGLGAR